MPIAPIQNYRPPFNRPSLAGAEMLQLAGPTVMGPNNAISSIVSPEQMKMYAAEFAKKAASGYKNMKATSGDDFMVHMLPHMVRSLEMIGKAGVRLKDPNLVSETTNRLHQLLQVFPQVQQQYAPEVSALMGLLGGK